MHVACNYHYLGWLFTWKYQRLHWHSKWSMYIIQIMLQYTPSFNKVCYALRLQGCFLWIYKTKYYASAGGYVAHSFIFFAIIVCNLSFQSEPSSKSRERSVARNALIEGFLSLLPEVQRKLVFESQTVPKKNTAKRRQGGFSVLGLFQEKIPGGSELRQ